MKDALNGGNMASSYVDGSEIKIAKLVSTLLGATWIAFATGIMDLMRAIALVHIHLLERLEGLIRAIIGFYWRSGAATIRIGWSEAFRAASETSALFAPVIMSIEIVVVAAILLWVRRRFL